jgi:hypothetical protein
MALCEPKKASPLPASPETVASFVDTCRLAVKASDHPVVILDTLWQCFDEPLCLEHDAAGNWIGGEPFVGL